MAVPEVRQVIAECPHEAVANIKVRAGSLEVGAVTVIGLRRIRHVVLPVRSVIDRMRPRIIDDGSKPANVAQRKTQLHRVVIRVRSCLELIDIEEGSALWSEWAVVERPGSRDRGIDGLIYIAVPEELGSVRANVARLEDDVP